MDKINKIHIIEEQVVNKTFFEPIEKELTCIICSGILVDPISCKECENPFCSICIEEWIKKDDQCVLKCNAPFQNKPISRMTRNIMDKVMIKCTLCEGELTLNNYPSHFRNCLLANRTIECPFCSCGKLQTDNLKSESTDQNVILSYFPKINQQIRELKEDNLYLKQINDKSDKIINDVKVEAKN